MIITREEFDNLQICDTLKNENKILSVEAKFANSIIALTNEGNAYIYSLRELQNAHYSIIQKIQNNCGFPYGDYSDREVVVKLSDESMDICKEISYGRLLSVSKEGFVDHCNSIWKFASLVTNNVDLVK